MKYLVTGASGYIGIHLVKKMSEMGIRTRALVRPTSDIRRLTKLKNVEIVYGNLTDISSLERAVGGVQVVYHAGALTNDWGDYRKFYTVNYLGTKNILKASIQAGVKKFIHVSSICVLDLSGRSSIRENRAYENLPPGYSRSKVKAEQLVRRYSHLIQTVIIRPPAVYGPEDPQCTTRSLKLARKHLLFFVDRGEGIFPHVYIDNLIEALLLAAQKKEAVGEIFNITDSVDTSAREFFNYFNHIAGRGNIRPSLPHSLAWLVAFLMDFFARLTGKPPLMSWTALRFLTLKCRFDVSKAKEKLGYEAVIQLEEGMQRVKHWWVDQ